MVCSREKRSWPAGTGVCVVKTHLLRTCGEVSFSGCTQRSASQLAFKQRQGKQRRVAFVHVVHIHPMAKRVSHASAAHAQHNLLLQAVIAVAAVEVIGQTAIPSRIHLKIRIEQIDRNHVPVAAHQVIAPCTHRHNAVFHCNRNPCRFLGAEVRRIPLLNVFALNAFAVQVLLEESLAVQQCEGHQRNSQIGSGTQRIAGQNAKTAGVGGHGSIDRDLHRVVRDQAFTGKFLIGKWF